MATSWPFNLKSLTGPELSTHDNEETGVLHLCVFFLPTQEGTPRISGYISWEMKRPVSCQRMVVFTLAWTMSARTNALVARRPIMSRPTPSHVATNSRHRYAASQFSSLQTENTSISSSSKLINLHTIPNDELATIVQSWGHAKYRAQQIQGHIRQGVTSVDEMANLPKMLRESLNEFACIGSLTLDTELVSKDGTRKRAYRLHDGHLIESVLMPYNDGRYTACISSQAGCAMGCVFCATGQSGFDRQLSADEIFEQVSRFAAELQAEASETTAASNTKEKRLSNVVFMGMGEPLANYRNVVQAVQRITRELGIGARKITISTVGIVPNIRKLMHDPDVPQVRLAVSLHCASDEERSALLPANARYGGLHELMTTLQEYIATTGRRLTLEWALIEGQNDNPETAHRLGKLLTRDYHLRRDMIHINVIPLNPTGGYSGSPSGRARVNKFMQILQEDYFVSTTARVRRGIDIDAGCGQLKSTLEQKERNRRLHEEQQRRRQVDDDTSHVKKELQSFLENAHPPKVGVHKDTTAAPKDSVASFSIDANAVDFESEDWEDPEFDSDWEHHEASRLISLVQDTVVAPLQKPTTSITDDASLQQAKRRRKKLLKNLKAIGKLRGFLESGRTLNEEQQAKIAREGEWKSELESVQHNLQ